MFKVVNETGKVLATTKYGFSAYDHAGNLSDRTPDHTFTVINMEDGSVYGAYRNGEDVPC